MKNIFKKKLCTFILILFSLTTFSQEQDKQINFTSSQTSDPKMNQLSDHKFIQIVPIAFDSATPPEYARSFQDINGNIDIQGLFRVTKQENGQLVTSPQIKSLFPPQAIKEGAMNTFFSCRNFFIALGYKIMYLADSTYTASVWRSDDDLKTVTKDQARFILPEAGHVNYGTNGEWAGLFCHRGIIRLSDGSLLAAIYGNFESDTIVPTNPQSKLETKYKLRAFVVSSTDQGKTWHYYSSVAVSKLNHPDESEGFNEWNMVQLDDGRLLAVIRTGHFTPPVISFSGDQGRTWSEPTVNSELGATACDLCLLKLSDGRIALSYGEMIQPSGDHNQYFKDFKAGAHPRRCRLAISTTPAADHWQTWIITDYAGRSAYSTIFQLQPDLIIYQTGHELYKILIPK